MLDGDLTSKEYKEIKVKFEAANENLIGQKAN